MSKKNFTRAERYAVWTVHGEKCWLCSELLSYDQAHIDHIIPETFEGKDELNGILEQFGLSLSFDLNDWGNWLPAHAMCNQKKRAHVFRPSPMIQAEIERAINKTDAAQRAHDKFLTDRKLNTAFSQVLEAIERGSLSEEKLAELAKAAAREHSANRMPEMQGLPVMIAPGLVVLSDGDGRYILRGRSGIAGFRPKGDNLDPSWDCPNCGVTGWNGTQCIQCGMLIDPD
ncbi:HNH endonuclease [Brucella anthropi]|uniref:HNH endonuclease n=1 Tax=Brucella anthropi TaxID=529 RepID=UPI00124D48E3|nr:HNH endonuclease signature motif containing protein [Brucella anthropi]KAB2757956.1 HNH endonuclease [Brucella anthropi]